MMTANACIGEVADAARPPTLVRPVDGDVTRPFTFTREQAYTRGAHRGADLRARAGSIVRAPCAGRIAHTGAVPAVGLVITIACGDHRVTLGPLARVTPAKGAAVHPGSAIGRLGRGHGGALHLGVRAAGVDQGYVDPLALLVREPSPGPSAPRLSPRRSAPTAPLAPAAPPSVFAATPATVPWPAWAGLTLALASASGSGIAVRRRRRRRATPMPIRVVTPGSQTVL